MAGAAVQARSINAIYPAHPMDSRLSVDDLAGQTDVRSSLTKHLKFSKHLVRRVEDFVTESSNEL
jgi:hypothetical protein